MKMRRDWRCWGLPATAVCLCALLLAACGGVEVMEVVEEPAEEPMMEEPAEEEPVEEPMEEVEEPAEESFAPELAGSLEIWLPGYAGGSAVPESWFDEFMLDYPNVDLIWQYLSPWDYSAQLATAVAAGAPPDIALMDYNMVAAFTEQGRLLPVDNLIDVEDYLVEAIDLVAFDGYLFGAPWLRAGCTADYQYLTVFDNDGLSFDATAALFDFLTQPQYQYEFFEVGAWLPTDPVLYDELGIFCDTNPVVRLEPVLVAETIQTVQVEWQTLAPLLGSVQLNAEKATAVTLPEVIVHAAPVFASPTADEALAQLDGNGLLLGAIFADQPFRNYPAGNYTVTCRRSGNVWCILTSPDGYEIEVEPDRFEEGLPSVPFATVVVEEGSRDFCWGIDGLKFCLRVG